MQVNSGKVVAVGPGARDKSGNVIPVCVKEGDTVLLPEYGGTQVKLGEKEYVFFHFFLPLIFFFLSFNIWWDLFCAGFICTGMRIFWEHCMTDSLESNFFKSSRFWILGDFNWEDLNVGFAIDFFFFFSVYL